MKKSLFFLLTGLACFAAHAQNDSASSYTWREIMIPMRDGVKLHTIVYTPKKQTEKLPFVLIRTPYGVGTGYAPDKNDYIKDMAADGYIFIAQDIRGRYKSEGGFEMTRPSRNKKDPQSIDEASDTYDTIDWLLKNIPGNNGNAGILGISYDGWLAIIAAADPHPALKAVSEQATPYDMFTNDDFHHNGAFRLSYGFEYAVLTEAAKTDSLYNFGEYDTYDWYLRLGPLSNINKKYAHGSLPTWNNFMIHPNYDDYWHAESLRYRLDYPKVPIQHVGGWWDEEDMVGPQEAYAQLEKKDTSHRNFLVIGPWLHGQWGGDEANNLAAIKFGQPTGTYFRQEIQAKWFAYYLKGKGDGNFAEMTSFQTGSNEWKHYNTWPPKESTIKKIYLHADGKLSFDKPSVNEPTAFDSYLSDPAKPVPYRTRPVEETYGQNSHWYFWLAANQRFVDNRPDVAHWLTDTLTEDITITGDVIANIFASTSGTDADWVVKLIDVYPNVDHQELSMSGYELMINADILRARFRHGFSTPEPLTPGKIEAYTLDLHGADHVFKKGHRIMVQVQSTWFPVYDRNPQKYVPNIYEAKESDYQTATQKIYHTAVFPSCIELPVVQL
ncbi:CocE/NonD family hydrolase [Dinghuibacter silviterrae]|nr:CocE/NonD family hydrolase [Dinghuibacter silviterrae]